MLQKTLSLLQSGLSKFSKVEGKQEMGKVTEMESLKNKWLLASLAAARICHAYPHCLAYRAFDICFKHFLMAARPVEIKARHRFYAILCNKFS